MFEGKIKTWSIKYIKRPTSGLRLHSGHQYLLLLLEALQLQRSFGLLSEFLPFDPVSDAVLPVCYFHPYYIALYIILPSIFRFS
jgi:hypothetical protein